LKRRLVVILPFLLAACGEPESAVVAATVRISALLQDEIKSLAFFALAPDRSDGVQLTCSTLMKKEIEPDDSRVEGLARVVILLADLQSQAVTLDGVSAGGNRLVYADGEGVAGTVIANGCTEYITVNSGETTTIELDLWRL
jgi:hypothetical protein